MNLDAIACISMIINCDPCIITRELTENVQKCPISDSVSSICTKSSCALFWAQNHPPFKFCGNLFSSFCVILLTNQHTHKLTHQAWTWKHNLLCGRNQMGLFILELSPCQLCYGYCCTWGQCGNLFNLSCFFKTLPEAKLHRLLANPPKCIHITWKTKK